MASLDPRETLGALVAATLNFIERGRKEGTFVPTQQVYFRWRLQGDLTYSEQGVKVPSARGETSVRPSWAIAVAVVAQREAPQLKEYHDVVAILQNVSRV